MPTRPDTDGPSSRELSLEKIEQEIERILAIPDDPLRNLRVTLGYHDLSRALARLIGTGDATIAWSAITSRLACSGRSHSR